MTDDPDDAADEEPEALERDAAEGTEWEPEGFLSAVVVRPKPAFLEWVRSVMPPDEEVEGAMSTVVVLAPELPRQGQLRTWVQQHHEEIFAKQLVVWTEDESRWPADLSFGALCAFFDIELAAGVDDLRHRPLLPDVTCEPVSLKLLVAVFVGLPDGGTLYSRRAIRSRGWIVAERHRGDARPRSSRFRTGTG